MPVGSGFLHKYCAHKLKEYAEATWSGSVGQIGDESRSRPADVTVTVLERSSRQKEQVTAFEVFMTGQAKEVRGIAKEPDLFNRTVRNTFKGRNWQRSHGNWE